MYKYEQNKTSAGFLVQVFTFLSHSNFGPYVDIGWWKSVKTCAKIIKIEGLLRVSDYHKMILLLNMNKIRP